MKSRTVIAVLWTSPINMASIVRKVLIQFSILWKLQLQLSLVGKKNKSSVKFETRNRDLQPVVMSAASVVPAIATWQFKIEEFGY